DAPQRELQRTAPAGDREERRHRLRRREKSGRNQYQRGRDVDQGRTWNRTGADRGDVRAEERFYSSPDADERAEFRVHAPQRGGDRIFRSDFSGRGSDQKRGGAAS